MPTLKQPNWSDPQLRNVLEKYREGQLSGSQTRVLIEGWLSGYGYREKKMITGTAPEGYYYRPEDVRAYNQQIIEYNSQVRAYRQSVVNALISGSQPGATVPGSAPMEPGYLRSGYISQEGQDPDILVSSPADIGPPAPSDEELARRLRLREMGLPTERPTVGQPRPGTLGYKIQESIPQIVDIMSGGPVRRQLEEAHTIVYQAEEYPVAPTFDIDERYIPGLEEPITPRKGKTVSVTIPGVLELADRPFTAISDSIRKSSAELKEASVEEAMKEPASPSDVPLMMDWLRGEEITEKVALPNVQAIKGLGLYLGGVGLGTAVTAFDVATFEYRPGLWSKTVSGVQSILFDPGAQVEFVKIVEADPFAFTVENIVGFKLGLSAKEFTAVKLTEAYRITKPYVKIAIADAKLGKISEIPETWKAIRGRQKVDMDLTHFEKELNLDFPEETVELEQFRQIYRRSSLTTYDLKTGLVKEKLPYYIEAEPEFIKTQEILEAADDWSPARIIKSPDYYTALPYDETGSILVKGKLGGMKPIKEPKVASPPRSEAIQVVTTEGVKITPIKAEGWIKPVEIEYVNIESVPANIPAVRLTDVITPMSIKSPGGLTKFGLSPITGFGWREKPVDIDRVKDVNVIGLKKLEKTLESSLQEPTLEFKLDTSLLDKPIPLNKVGVDQIPREITKPTTKTTQIILPNIDVPTIDELKEPEMDFPSFNFYPPELPRQRRRAPDLGAEEKKKDKKKKRRAKGVFEARVDFPDIKMPKIKEAEL